MTMLIDLLIVSLAAAFIIVAVERWVDISWLRGIVAYLLSLGGTFSFGGYRDVDLFWLSFATGFVTLVLLLVGERLASEPPIVVKDRNQTL